MNKKGLFAIPLFAVVILAGCTGNQTDTADTGSDSSGSNNAGSVGVTISNGDAAADSAVSLTLDEVSQHDSADDCWMVIEGSVYDVTDYIDQHPGENEILRGCGIDATVFFTSEANGGHAHSASAELVREEYLLGELAL